MSQAGEVTLRFRSAVLSSTEAVDAFTLLSLPVTPPVEPRLTFSFRRNSSSAWPRIDFRSLLNAVAPAQPATKILLLPNFASPATPGVSFPMSLESCIPRRAPRSESPTSIEPFTFLRSRKCSFQIATLLPTDVRVGLTRLWTQVQNLTKLWIRCLYFRILKNSCLIRCRRRVPTHHLLTPAYKCNNIGALCPSSALLSGHKSWSKWRLNAGKQDIYISNPYATFATYLAARVRAP